MADTRPDAAGSGFMPPLVGETSPQVRPPGEARWHLPTALTVRLEIAVGRVAMRPVPVLVRGARAVRALGTWGRGPGTEAANGVGRGRGEGSPQAATVTLAVAALHPWACRPGSAPATPGTSPSRQCTHLLQLGDEGLELIHRGGQGLDLRLQLVDLLLQLGRRRGGSGRGAACAGQQGGKRHKRDGGPARGGECRGHEHGGVSICTRTLEQQRVGRQAHAHWAGRQDRTGYQASCRSSPAAGRCSLSVRVQDSLHIAESLLKAGEVWAAAVCRPRGRG